MTNAATVDLTALADDLAYASGRGIEDVAHELVAQAATEVAAQMKAFAPKRTGFMADSITVSFPDPLSAVIGPSAFYAPFVEFGTRGPYVIRPKKPGGVLVFYVGGKKVVTRKVTHPGNKPHPFARPAAAAVVADLNDRFSSAGARLVTG